MKDAHFIGCSMLVVLAGCAPNPTGALAPLSGDERSATTSTAARAFVRSATEQSKIQHIVFIIQENRSVDDLFQKLRGADTQSYGLNSQGETVPLAPRLLTADYDLAHIHPDWLKDFDGGAMNGFDLETCKGKCPRNPSYGYVPRDEVEPYYAMAEAYTFSDHMFQTNQGPSFPAHQYLISGTSAVATGSHDRAADNPAPPGGGLTGGCDSPAGSLVSVINPGGGEPNSLRQFPCFDRKALMNELDDADVSWRYYQATTGPGLWNAVDAIRDIWRNRYEYQTHVITPSSQVLTDIANNKLASVVWVTPTKAASDHPRVNNGSGPSWVASVVNAIGTSPYWQNTAIFITWDDWGGWYDHVPPQIYNTYELSFRVPLIVVSPYARVHYIDHSTHEFGSLLKFAEKTFGLRSLHTTDERSDDLFDCFDFNKSPAPFNPIPAKYPARYFYKLPAVEADD
jgi:phospholipase C